MASTSVGHAKNVANFQDLIRFNLLAMVQLTIHLKTV